MYSFIYIYVYIYIHIYLCPNTGAMNDYHCKNSQTPLDAKTWFRDFVGFPVLIPRVSPRNFFLQIIGRLIYTNMCIHVYIYICIYSCIYMHIYTYPEYRSNE